MRGGGRSTTSGGTTAMEQFGGRGRYCREQRRKDEVRGQGFGNLREDGFEELDATVDPIIRFPELRMES